MAALQELRARLVTSRLRRTVRNVTVVITVVSKHLLVGMPLHVRDSYLFNLVSAHYYPICLKKKSPRTRWLKPLDAVICMHRRSCAEQELLLVSRLRV